MAVYTEVSLATARTLFKTLQLGKLTRLQGIQGGIENTNYFASTDRDDYVVTLFERLSFEQLPFYLELMRHLASKGIPVPDPVPHPASGGKSGLVHTVCGKPAAVVNRLKGRSELHPDPAHCAAVGAMLARMHLAGRDFPLHQPNLRGLAWWNETVPIVIPHLTGTQVAVIESELAYQNHVAQSPGYAALPRGPIHADLFRDNVMFDAGELSGFFDFYFAGVDAWLFDLSVCLNDWCIDWPTGQADAGRAEAFLGGYQSVRPLESAERSLLAAMTRAAALRFWVSRLWDFHLPREASLLIPHDPTHFERVLMQRREHPFILPF